MRLLRRLYFPLYYHKLLQRLNLLHYGANDYFSAVSTQAAYGYPLLTVREREIDSRRVSHMEIAEVERELEEALRE